jgi:hypothetical protein
LNANGAALLTNPHPCGHIVYPYTDEGLVGQAVSLFASAGLRAGEGVILIMSETHTESIKLRLQLEGIGTDAFEDSGKLVCLTAEELLSKFISGGVLNEGLFSSTVGGLIEKCRARLGRGSRAPVRVFGEMVSQLRSTDLAATTRLEVLWNDVIKDHSVALLCTYSLNHADDHVPAEIIGLHSHTIEREHSHKA